MPEGQEKPAQDRGVVVTVDIGVAVLYGVVVTVVMITSQHWAALHGP